MPTGQVPPPPAAKPLCPCRLFRLSSWLVLSVSIVPLAPDGGRVLTAAAESWLAGAGSCSPAGNVSGHSYDPYPGTTTIPVTVTYQACLKLRGAASIDVVGISAARRCPAGNRDHRDHRDPVHLLQTTGPWPTCGRGEMAPLSCPTTTRAQLRPATRRATRSIAPGDSGRRSRVPGQAGPPTQNRRR